MKRAERYRAVTAMDKGLRREQAKAFVSLRLALHAAMARDERAEAEIDRVVAAVQAAAEVYRATHRFSDPVFRALYDALGGVERAAGGGMPLPLAFQDFQSALRIANELLEECL